MENVSALIIFIGGVSVLVCGILSVKLTETYESERLGNYLRVMTSIAVSTFILGIVLLIISQLR